MSRVSGLIKYFTIAAIVILLLLFGFRGFLSYQDHASYKNAVHQDAALIIRIDRNQLIQKIGLNALLNPGYYFKADEKDSLDVEEDEERNNGFDTRANIFIFNLKGAPSTFYSTFEVTDSAALKVFLKDKFKMGFKEYATYCNGLSSDNKLQAAFNNQRLVISYALDKQHNHEATEQMLFKNQLLNTDDRRFSKLKDNEQDLIFVNGENVGNLSFEDGRIILAASLQMEDYLKIQDQSFFAEVDTLSSLHLSLVGNFSSVLAGDYTINDMSISLDSILYNYNGYLDFKVSGKINQADTIITYEYDDDFEKIETKTIQEKEVPGISLLMKANAAEIQRLLTNEKIVQGSHVNRDVFPLLKLGFRTEDAGTIRITNMGSQHILPISDSDKIFSLYADFPKLKAESAIPIPEEFLEDLEKLEIAAFRREGKIAVGGELLLTKSQINALMQLID